MLPIHLTFKRKMKRSYYQMLLCFVVPHECKHLFSRFKMMCVLFGGTSSKTETYQWSVPH